MGGEEGDEDGVEMSEKSEEVHRYSEKFCCDDVLSQRWYCV